MEYCKYSFSIYVSLLTLELVQVRALYHIYLFLPPGYLKKNKLTLNRFFFILALINKIALCVPVYNCTKNESILKTNFHIWGLKQSYLHFNLQTFFNQSMNNE